jgi:hypothetical protein
MHHRLLVLLALRLCLASVLRAEAQTTTAATARAVAAHPTHRMPGVLCSALDLNHDGILSAEELAQAPTVLRALDPTRDGNLSADELHRHDQKLAQRGVVRPAAHATAGWLLAFTLDANHDGVIEAAEIANAILSLGSLDTNGGGRITRREIRAAGAGAAVSRPA